MRIIQRYFFLLLNKNICCDPSLEPARRDGSNDGLQNMFLWRHMANYPQINPVTPLSGALYYCLVFPVLITLFPRRFIIISIHYA